MKLFEYQSIAVKKMIDIAQDKKTVRFQAPTGAGKTFITAKFIEGILRSQIAIKNKKISFVYIAPSTGQLDYQGYSKIKNYRDNGDVDGFSSEHIGKGTKTSSANYLANIDYFEKNKVYFIGWDILKERAKVFSDGENMNLFDIVDKTHEKGTKIILLIDEAHREYSKKTGADIKIRQKFLNLLDPILTVEMSATLDGEPDVKIRSTDVKEAGVIKQSIKINDIQANWDQLDKNKELVKNGIIKRQEIENAIKKTNFNINPLLLIQIPDGVVKVDGIDVNNYYMKLIKEVCDEFGIKEGFDLAIWLDKNKTTFKKEDITTNTSQYKVVIFKQAIATGWDVPRASTLVKLRNPKAGSKSFEVQTLGRILRNPFISSNSETRIFKRSGSLTNDDVINLNSAFVYTNDSDWKTKSGEIEDYSGIVEKETIIYAKTEKAKLIPLKMNKVSVVDIPKNILDVIASNIFKEEKVVKALIDNAAKDAKFENKSISNSTLDTSAVAGGHIKVVGSNNYLNLSNDKLNLFGIYIQFLQTTKNNYIIKKLADLIANSKSATKKQVYLAFINNYNTSFFERSSLEEALNIAISKHIKRFVKYEVEGKFVPREEIEYYKEQGFRMELPVNTYDIVFNQNRKAFDSQIEIDFYEKVMANVSTMGAGHLFRNKTNVSDSYFIKYLSSSEGSINSFFPDFIFTKENEIFIIECKGLGNYNTDKNAEDKMEALKVNAKIISDSQEIIPVKVGRFKEGEQLEAIVYGDEYKTISIDKLFEMMKNEEPR